MITNPCKYCVAPKRKPGCHSMCQEHKEWEKVDNERKEAIKRNKAKEITHLKK